MGETAKPSPLFGADGALAAHVPGYEVRGAQRDLAAAIRRCLRDGGTMLAEAPTGTGKSLAYLIPAALADKRVIVSTYSKSLQHQLWDKDLPLVEAALERPVKAALLKGRQNYLCLRRYEEFLQGPQFETERDLGSWPAFRQWVEQSETGDREEWEDIPESIAYWRRVMSTSETCLGPRCPLYHDSFTTRARGRANDADLILVNHHLFFADWRLRLEGRGELLPDYDAVIFDEAHHIEEVATQFLGVMVSEGRVDDLTRDGRQYLAEETDEFKLRWLPLIAAVEDKSLAFLTLFERTPGRHPLGSGDWSAEAGEACDQWRKALIAFSEAIEAKSFQSERLNQLGRRAALLAADLEILADVDDEESVRWIESRGRRPLLHVTPLSIADLLGKRLFEEVGAAVLTSATLSVEGGFDYLRERLGLEPKVPGYILPEVFDYPSQGLVYVPETLGEPNDPEWRERALDETEWLLRASRGRGLVLCTSHANLEFFGEELRDRLPYAVLIQGEGGRSRLLEKFREDVHSVLVATAAFWEGVDISGESLTCLVIDRLPFAPPDDPVDAARMDRLQTEGENPFWCYSVPRAVLRMRQGAGRLIRSRDDRGILAILDQRLVTKRYGKSFVRSLPPMPLSRRREDIETFLARPVAAAPAEEVCAR